MKLITKLKSDIVALKASEFPLENEYLFYERFAQLFFEEKNYSVLNGIDLLFFLFVLNKNDMDINKLYEIFDPILKRSTNFEKIQEFLEFLNLLEGIKKFISLEQLTTYTNDFNTKHLISTLININIPNGLNPKIYMTKILMKYRDQGLELFGTSELLKRFIDIFYNYPRVLHEDYSTLVTYRDNYEEIQFLKSKIFKEFYDFKAIENQSGEEMTIKEVIEESDISPLMTMFSSNHAEITKKRKNYKKDINKTVILYNEIIAMLEQLENGSLNHVSISEDIYKKLNPEIYFELMKIVLEHNRKIYTELELKNIKSDRYDNIEKAFIANNIPINDLSSSQKEILFKNINLQELEKILQFLSKDHWSWLNIGHPNFVQIILNSTADIFKYIDSLLSSEFISSEFIKNNIGILVETIKFKVENSDIQPLYGLFKSNIEILSRNAVSIDRRILKNESLLLMPSDVLRKAIKLAKKYQLNFKGPNSKSYGFYVLNNIYIFDYLDSFIELGYANYIKENIQSLRTDSKESIIRLSIMENIGLNSMTKEDRLSSSITTGKNFYVNHNQLQEFVLLTVDEYVDNKNFAILKNSERLVISKQTEQLEVVKMLDDLFQISELEYQINDNVISRIKFLRNLECLLSKKKIDNDVIFAALTFNSVLDASTLDYIRNIFSTNIPSKVIKL